MLKRQWRDLEHRILVVTFLKLVIRDSRAEVMDVMETDIPRKPLQHFGKFIERATLYASVKKFPFRVVFPIRWVKIMLDVEEPDARSTRDQQDRHFHQKKSSPANFQHDPAD